LEKRSGGNVWVSGSYDPTLNLFYVGTGQTYDIDLLLTGMTTPGSNDGLYMNTTLAFRPETGELVWHYQHHNREVWDLDWSFERTLATLTIDGKPRRVVTTAGKLGIFDVLDAANGAYISSFDSGLQDLIDKIDPKTGVKHVAERHEPKPNAQDFVCPSPVGARNWPSTSFNPNTGIMYVPLIEACGPYMWRPGAPVRDFQKPPVHPKDSDGMVGRVQAFDLASGKKIWMERRRSQGTSAILATAGGLVFEGSRDRWFRASDDRTGKVLWQMRLDNSPSSLPISYSVDGVQYIAVVTGSGNSQDLYVGRLTPEIPQPPSSATLWTFRVVDPKKVVSP
jgi:alcohol dehydrogenase (cytochrome c)